MSENSYDLMRNALSEARDTMRAADRSADALADILRSDNRLRQVSAWKLKELKRQLQQFDAHTQKWKAGA